MKASRPPVPVIKNTKKRRLKTWIIVLISVVIVLGIAVGLILANLDEFKKFSQDRKVVAVCNGYEIPYEELVFLTSFYKQELADKYGDHIWDDPDTAEQYREELETLVKNNLNQNYVVLSAAKQLGIKTSGDTIDNYVDQQVELLTKECGGEKAYKKFLSEQHMTEHYLRFTFSTEYIKSAIHYTLLDNDIYEYRYEDNASDFMQYVLESGNYVRTLHVYIANEEGEDPAANLAQAQKVSDALQAAETVEERRELLGEYIGSTLNDDYTIVTGDGYYFTRGEMTEEYEKASFALDIGETSAPIVCGGGTFVIMRLAPEAEYVENNVKELMNAYYGVCLGEYMEQFRPSCDVFYTEYGQTLDLLDLD